MEHLHFLHLEDDEFEADLVHRAVQRLGIVVEWRRVATADDYTGALAEGRFDAIVSDSSVPGLEGLRALQLARAQQPESPFIFVSGHADEQSAQQSLAAGAMDHVPKNQLWRLAPALQHLRARSERERLAQRMHGKALLVDIVRQLSLARSLTQIMAIVRHGARELTQADGATFILRDGEQCHYADEEAIGPLWKGRRFPMAACVSGWVMLNREPAVIPDIYQDPRVPIDAYRPTFVKSMVMVPIRSESPIGAIGNYWARPRRLGSEEVSLLQALADTTSVAMENVQLLHGLEQRVQQRTIELEEANAGLEAFSYSVAHDLRAPLRAIGGYGGLLVDHHRDRLDAEGQGFLDRVCKSARRMESLIDDLLKLAHVARSEVRHRPVDLGQLAQEIVTAMREQSPRAGMTVCIGSGLKVDGDMSLLRLVLENLLSNAWKYTARQADAQIDFNGAPTADGQLVCQIRDNGAGFDMALAQHLFEPFQRLHSDAEFPGTGIGLAIVRRAIHKLGGRLWAESEKGCGATFYFALPMTRS
ncbi:sensor histidine kinase [Methylibium sp.]|uniref:sensor histidine kinase n=1 Tax=Methylibium sp. TaxID=2067992 RepID=UPI003D0A4FDE